MKTKKLKPAEYPGLSDQSVLSYALYLIDRQYEAKFRAGMEKYTTPIWEKSGINEAFPEIWDLVSYLTLAKLQMARINRLVTEDLAESFPAMRKHPAYRQLCKLSGEKPLAQAAKVHSTFTSTISPNKNKTKNKQNGK